MRLLSFACVLGLAATTHAQPLPPPPPPRVVAVPVVSMDAPVSHPREIQEETPPARGLLHLGLGFGILAGAKESSGYRQLSNIGLINSPFALHVNGGAQLVATSWLRIGTELSYAFTGFSDERNVRNVVRDERVRFHMGMIDLTVTPYVQIRRLQLGLRLAGGYGFSRWTQSSLAASTSGIYNVSAAFDLYVPLARRSNSGLNVRIGYQFRQTTETGPLDLVFDQSAVFFNFAFMYGVGS